VQDLCRKHGLSSPTFYKWKAKYGGMDVSEARCLKGLEDENAKLKRTPADAMLDNVALKDLLGKMVTPAAHREAVAYLQPTYKMSQRRACRVIGTDRTSVRYQAMRPDDGFLRERLGSCPSTTPAQNARLGVETTTSNDRTPSSVG